METFTLMPVMKLDGPKLLWAQRQKNAGTHLRLRRPALSVMLIALGAVVVALAFGWLFLPLSLVVTPLTHGPAIQAVYATGTVEVSVTIRIAPQIGGRLIELKADEGSVVKAGEVLARLDDNDLRASVAELEARAWYAGQQFERAATLRKRGWSTQERFDQTQSEMNAARQAAQHASEQLAFMSLKTPSDGLVIRRDGEVGDYIPVNQPVFYIAKAGAPLRISADVDEEDVPLVKVGQQVLIRSDAFPERVFNGEVKEVTPKGDPVARSYRIRVELPSDTTLMIGMTAEINIVTAQKQEALLVPSSALSGTSLWIVRDGKLDRIAVRVGVRGRDRIEVSGELRNDDLVVTDPSPGLKVGQAVRVRIQGLVAPSQPVQEEGK